MKTCKKAASLLQSGGLNSYIKEEEGLGLNILGSVPASSASFL